MTVESNRRDRSLRAFLRRRNWKIVTFFGLGACMYYMDYLDKIIMWTLIKIGKLGKRDKK